MADDPLIVSWTEFLKKLAIANDSVLDNVKETITQEATATHKRILDNLDHFHGGGTGGLAKSLKMSKIGGSKDTRSYFGYKFVFDGYDDKGRPYQAIANTLNIGNAQKGIMPSYFISNSFSALKGMNQRIIDNVDKYLEEQNILDGEK